MVTVDVSGNFQIKSFSRNLRLEQLVKISQVVQFPFRFPVRLAALGFLTDLCKIAIAVG